MSELENKIKELEYKLALKKAYLDVQFKFSKGIDQAIKDEVSSKMKELAEKLADSQESVLFNETSKLSSEDIELLKMLASSVRERKTAPIAPKATSIAPKINTTNNSIEQQSTQEPSIDDGTQTELIGRMAIMLTLDGVLDVKQRGKLTPQGTVKILSINNNLAYVQDLRGNKFNIPVEDLELKNRRERNDSNQR